MKYSCEICNLDFIEEDEEDISFIENGCPPICTKCFSKEFKKLCERSNNRLQKIRECKV